MFLIFYLYKMFALNYSNWSNENRNSYNTFDNNYIKIKKSIDAINSWANGICVNFDNNMYKSLDTSILYKALKNGMQLNNIYLYICNITDFSYLPSIFNFSRNCNSVELYSMQQFKLFDISYCKFKKMKIANLEINELPYTIEDLTIFSCSIIPQHIRNLRILTCQNIRNIPTSNILESIFLDRCNYNITCPHSVTAIKLVGRYNKFCIRNCNNIRKLHLDGYYDYIFPILINIEDLEFKDIYDIDFINTFLTYCPNLKKFCIIGYLDFDYSSNTVEELEFVSVNINSIIAPNLRVYKLSNCEEAILPDADLEELYLHENLRSFDYSKLSTYNNLKRLMIDESEIPENIFLPNSLEELSLIVTMHSDYNNDININFPNLKKLELACNNATFNIISENIESAILHGTRITFQCKKIQNLSVNGSYIDILPDVEKLHITNFDPKKFDTDNFTFRCPSLKEITVDNREAVTIRFSNPCLEMVIINRIPNATKEKNVIAVNRYVKVIEK